jgi:hemolysin III
VVGTRNEALNEVARKPLLRGVFHQWAFFLSLATGGALITSAHGGRALLAAAVFAAAVSALLGVSALYHRIDWRASARRWMRRLDHAMIFVLIAATYTPFALIALHGTLATVLLIVAWSGALGGIVLQLAWPGHPKWASSIIAMALGWAGVAAMTQLPSTIGWLAVAAVIVGGLTYSLGAVVYARERPNPWPGVFGYHEVFHVLVLLAAALMYSVIAFAVLPLAA